MLLVEHYIGPSNLHGLGVFSAAFVAKGAKIWEFNPIVDRDIPLQDLDKLPSHVVFRIKKHAEFISDRGVYRLATDGDLFMNHADDPNVADDGDVCFAARDIHPGEEIVCDYRVCRVETFNPDIDLPFVQPRNGEL